MSANDDSNGIQWTSDPQCLSKWDMEFSASPSTKRPRLSSQNLSRALFLSPPHSPIVPAGPGFRQTSTTPAYPSPYARPSSAYASSTPNFAFSPRRCYPARDFPSTNLRTNSDLPAPSLLDFPTTPVRSTPTDTALTSPILRQSSQQSNHHHLHHQHLSLQQHHEPALLRSPDLRRNSISLREKPQEDIHPSGYWLRKRSRHSTVESEMRAFNSPHLEEHLFRPNHPAQRNGSRRSNIRNPRRLRQQQISTSFLNDEVNEDRSESNNVTTAVTSSRNPAIRFNDVPASNRRLNNDVDPQQHAFLSTPGAPPAILPMPTSTVEVTPCIKISGNPTLSTTVRVEGDYNAATTVVPVLVTSGTSLTGPSSSFLLSAPPAATPSSMPSATMASVHSHHHSSASHVPAHHTVPMSSQSVHINSSGDIRSHVTLPATASQRQFHGMNNLPVQPPVDVTRHVLHSSARPSLPTRHVNITHGFANYSANQAPSFSTATTFNHNFHPASLSHSTQQLPSEIFQNSFIPSAAPPAAAAAAAAATVYPFYPAVWLSLATSNPSTNTRQNTNGSTWTVGNNVWSQNLGQPHLLRAAHIAARSLIYWQRHLQHYHNTVVASTHHTNALNSHYAATASLYPPYLVPLTALPTSPSAFTAVRASPTTTGLLSGLTPTSARGVVDGSQTTLNNMATGIPPTLFTATPVVPITTLLPPAALIARKRGLSRSELETLITYRFSLISSKQDLEKKRKDHDLGAFVDPAPTDASPNDDYMSNEESPKCMVCLDDLEENQMVRVLRCCHEYHVKCVDKWLRSNRSCPICRRDAFSGKSQVS